MNVEQIFTTKKFRIWSSWPGRVADILENLIDFQISIHHISSISFKIMGFGVGFVADFRSDEVIDRELRKLEKILVLENEEE